MELIDGIIIMDHGIASGDAKFYKLNVFVDRVVSGAPEDAIYTRYI